MPRFYPQRVESANFLDSTADVRFEITDVQLTLNDSPVRRLVTVKEFIIVQICRPPFGDNLSEKLGKNGRLDAGR